MYTENCVFVCVQTSSFDICFELRHSGMEDLTHMQDDVQRMGWKEQMLAFYKSWVTFTLACYFFLLRLLQELFKTGGDVSLHEEKQTKSPSGTRNLRSAGEIQVEDNVKEESDLEHTVLDLHAAPTVPSPPLVTEPPKLTPTDAIPTQPVTSSIEPTTEQSKNTLVIKNLPFKFKLADLEKLLNEHQAKTKNVRLLRDESGKFTGMAFIRCASKDDAQRLISTMHGLEIAGRSIQVEFKTKKQKKKKGLTSSSDSLSSSSDENPRIRISSDKTSKLSASDEHVIEKKLPTQRRKSTSTFDTLYSHSALARTHNYSYGPTIRPIRQPIGPDGKTNGFSAEYRRARTVNRG